MLEIIALLCLPGALLVLYFLAVTDLKTGFLPNELVLALALLGFLFHFSTLFAYSNLTDMALGAFIGGGLLYLIRLAANLLYKDEALGLGDVKLLAAAGIWLGAHNILIALTVGAFAGLVHGLLLAVKMKLKTKTQIDLKKLSLPAGPGFAAGIVLAGALKFYNFPSVFLS